MFPSCHERVNDLPPKPLPARSHPAAARASIALLSMRGRRWTGAVAAAWRDGRDVPTGRRRRRPYAPSPPPK